MTNHVAEIARDQASIARNAEALREACLIGWDGTYGYNAGQAHPSVEHVACPVCKAPPGVLCMGATRRTLGRHYKRADAYTALKRARRFTLVAAAPPTPEAPRADPLASRVRGASRTRSRRRTRS
jgi:hypothetical protein